MKQLLNMKLYLLLFFLIFASWSFAQNKDTLQPTETEAIVHLTFKNSEGEVMAGERIVFEGKTSGEEYEVKTDKNGEVQLLLPEGETYYIKIDQVVKEQKQQEMVIEDVPGIQNFGVLLTYAPPMKIILDNVYFDTDKADLRAESFNELDKLFSYLERHKYARIEISGHTDNVGDSAHNLELSRNRARSVLIYLTRKGIDSRRLSAKGYGDMQPIADNDTEEGRQQNRRVEVRFLNH